jgi:hypothetical protein
MLPLPFILVFGKIRMERRAAAARAAARFGQSWPEAAQTKSAGEYGFEAIRPR